MEIILGVIAFGWLGLIAWNTIGTTSLLKEILHELKRIQ